MNATFQNSSQALSIGIFFTLMILGLSSSLSAALDHGLIAHGVDAATAQHVSRLPPVSVLFAAFLGYNPIQQLVPASALNHVSQANYAILTGKSFFPTVISGPFKSGLNEAFIFAIVTCVIAAVASWSRGTRYVDESVLPSQEAEPEAEAVPLPLTRSTSTPESQ